MEIITLSNGKRVGNFSSPHEFVFEDGSVLPARSPEVAKRLEMHYREEELDTGKGDILIYFELTSAIRKELTKWVELQYTKQVDVVIVPLPILQLIHSEWPYATKIWPFRVCRIVDRVKKTVSIHKQCL